MAASASALSRSVDDLVAAASKEADPRKLRPIVEKVLDAFDDANTAARNEALKAIGKALGKVEGHGAQILCLALGALVEGGASPDLAWPSVAKNLTSLLEQATDFVTSILKSAKTDDVDEALESAGASVAKKKPREAAAWKTLPARCLAGVACLSRSKALRAKVSADETLLATAWPLSDVVSEVSDLLQAARIVDGEKLLILAPALGRGWRAVMDSMSSNLELYVLLADAIGGAGTFPRPNAKAVAAIKEGATPKKPIPFSLPFLLVAGTAVDEDGSLPPVDPDATEHVVWVEGIPADIPKLGDERIVLLQESPFTEPVSVAPTFETLRPTLKIEGELTPMDVTRTMVKLAAAAAATKKKQAKPKKKTTKKTTKKK